ncbi:hypothetical protein BOTBODRAFT_604564 [Botryobasidium botryosum FD-172 SS1]|uniref:Uncharacterized protein n=1 Tax=Botryobasidium botryosum (strain FD-172 SS1) TaxID=930990 RepID=A0A067MZQ9_BOTB1|nr:hypothetical protein BOTBODRAFT_604564 [Botryobasidium botryosum FD-172 SS1]
MITQHDSYVFFSLKRSPTSAGPHFLYSRYLLHELSLTIIKSTTLTLRSLRKCTARPSSVWCIHASRECPRPPSTVIACISSVPALVLHILIV